jgi:hypothetical protein
MKCMHCLVEFHDDMNSHPIDNDIDGYWAIHSYTCPACKRMNLFLASGTGFSHGYLDGIISEIPVRPFGSNRPSCPSEVSPKIADDYKEACLVFPFSSKASAA